MPRVQGHESCAFSSITDLSPPLPLLASPFLHVCRCCTPSSTAILPRNCQAVDAVLLLQWMALQRQDRPWEPGRVRYAPLYHNWPQQSCPSPGVPDHVSCIPLFHGWQLMARQFLGSEPGQGTHAHILIAGLHIAALTLGNQAKDEAPPSFTACIHRAGEALGSQVGKVVNTPPWLAS